MTPQPPSGQSAEERAALTFSVALILDGGAGNILVQHSIITAATQDEALGAVMRGILDDPKRSKMHVAKYSILLIP